MPSRKIKKIFGVEIRPPEERKRERRLLKEATIETLRELKPKNLFRTKEEIKNILFRKK